MHSRSAQVKPRRILQKVKYTFGKFVLIESLSGYILLMSLIVAMFLANSRWEHAYHTLWEHTALGISFGQLHLEMSLHHFINDGLMAIFFFLVGLEIKRELIAGELANFKMAIFPVGSAIGGMMLPGLIFALHNFGHPTIRGWAIPAATDIAFALGILSLLGSRAPLSLKIFLTAVAIVDDIGAVIMIALFYSAPPQWVMLGIAFCLLACMIAMNRAGITQTTLYALFAIVLWGVVSLSGIHATLAGVAAAFTIPIHSRRNRKITAEQTHQLAGEIQALADSDKHVLNDKKYLSLLHQISALYEEAGSPLLRLEKALHPWVAFGIMPLFALSNGGITLREDMLGAVLSPLCIGIVAGLCLGKPLGIVGAAWLAEKTGWGERPAGMSWRTLWSGGCFAGIGFTMSIFIAGMAFTPATGLEEAKLAVLLASLLSAALGAIILPR